MHTSFRQILPQTVLKILDGRKPACGFLPTLQQNYARKSAHISYEDRFLITKTVYQKSTKNNIPKKWAVRTIFCASTHFFFFWLCHSPELVYLLSLPKGVDKALSGKGGFASGLQASDNSRYSLSSAAILFILSSPHFLQRCISAHSPSGRT